MVLYHGSTVDIKQIDLSKSKPNKDFGQGFYLSADREQAYRMAVYKALQQNKLPIVNTYRFDETVLRKGELSVKFFEGYTREWAEFILANRNNVSGNQVHSFDIVYGPIANDKVGAQIRNLMEHNIDMDTFMERLKYMKGITFQYFFGTERAVSLLEKV